MPRKPSSLNPLQARKQLLIAESEINRAHLVEDGRIIASGVRGITAKAKSISSLASIAGLLGAAFVSVRRKKTEKTNSSEPKFSWIQTALKGAKAVVPLWLALRRRRSQKISERDSG